MGYKPMLAVLDVDEARHARAPQPARRRRPARASCSSAGSRAPRRSASRASTSAWPAPPRCCPPQDGRRRGPPSPPRARRAPCSRARATCGAWTTRAACCACATPRACATSRCCWPIPASSSTPSTSPPRPSGGAATGAESAEGLAVRAGTGDAGPALDSQAKAEYRSRLEDLRAEIEEAESFNDPERAARAREEMDFIAHELSAAVGLGGRDRQRGLGVRARAGQRDARAAARDPAHRRRGREPRARAGDDRPHRHLLRLRAGPPAPGGVGSGCRLSATTPSSSGRASAARSSPAAWPQAGASVLVLERGQPWPPGAFPRTPRQWRGALWAPRRGVHGLFEYHHFKGLDSLTASGLGGGSLIYANVMLRKDPATFAADGLPLAPADLDRHYDAVERDAARRALSVGRPHARRRARCSTRRGSPACSAERPPLAVAFGDARAQPCDDGTGNLHGGAARDLPAVRRLRRRLPVRVQGDGRLHLPDRGRRRGRARALPAARRTPLDRDGEGWRVRYRQHLAARGGHPERLLDPVARDRPRGASPTAWCSRAAPSARPACCCATAPRSRGSARAWGAASRATATCSCSCSTPIATWTRPPGR